jgi:hypothetical protein
LLIGFGILSFIQRLSFLPLFSRIVYILAIVFAVILGILSLYDFVRLKQGRPSEMKLQLPDFLTSSHHFRDRLLGRDVRAAGLLSSKKSLLHQVLHVSALFCSGRNIDFELDLRHKKTTVSNFLWLAPRRLQKMGRVTGPGEGNGYGACFVRETTV